MLVNNNAYMAKQLCYGKLQPKNRNLFVQACNHAILKLLQLIDTSFASFSPFYKGVEEKERSDG